MKQSARGAAATPRVALRRFGIEWTLELQEQAVFALATLAAWAHTIDEIRIGELVAVPFGIVNLALVAAWPRLRRGWQAIASIGFGLFWGLAVIPYHVAPLISGDVTGQHISGQSRVVAGVAMVALGISIAVRRRRGARPPGPPQ